MGDQTHDWHHYRHSGLAVRSQLELPEWEQFTSPPAPDVDVTIRLEVLQSEPIVEVLPAGDRDLVTFSVADTARWRVADGKVISIDAAPEAPERALRLFTLGSAWGALGYQRGLAILHGSAVELGQGAILFGGTQEQGKSTMAAAMLARGAKLVSDDLARVDPGVGGTPRIYPSSSRLKLWQEAIDRFELQDQVIARDLFREDKYHCTAHATAGVDPVDLGAIVLLEWADDIALERLEGGEAVRAVLQATCYRPEMLETMGRTVEQAALVSAVVGQTPVYSLSRPRDLARIEEACGLVEKTLSGS